METVNLSFQTDISLQCQNFGRPYMYLVGPFRLSAVYIGVADLDLLRRSRWEGRSRMPQSGYRYEVVLDPAYSLLDGAFNLRIHSFMTEPLDQILSKKARRTRCIFFEQRLM